MKHGVQTKMGPMEYAAWFVNEVYTTVVAAEAFENAILEQDDEAENELPIEQEQDEEGAEFAAYFKALDEELAGMA